MFGQFSYQKEGYLPGSRVQDIGLTYSHIRFMYSSLYEIGDNKAKFGSSFWWDISMSVKLSKSCNFIIYLFTLMG
jgi:hypothetical protein